MKIPEISKCQKEEDFFQNDVGNAINDLSLRYDIESLRLLEMYLTVPLLDHTRHLSRLVFSVVYLDHLNTYSIVSKLSSCVNIKTTG